MLAAIGQTLPIALLGLVAGLLTAFVLAALAVQFVADGVLAFARG